MANDRLLLLSTVVLVAITVQIGAYPPENNPCDDDKLQLEKLGSDLLPPEEVKIILGSIKEPSKIYIGLRSVAKIKYLAAPSIIGGIMREKGCKYHDIVGAIRMLLVDNSNLFFNVFEFLHPKLMLCPENIHQIYRDLRRVKKLSTKDDLSKEEVERTFNSIEDKERVEIDKKRVQTILDHINMARKPDISVEDCDDVAPKYLRGSDIFAANMKKIDESRHRLVALCAVFGKLVADRLTSSLTDEDKRWFKELDDEYERARKKLFESDNMAAIADSGQMNERCSRLVPKLRSARYIIEETERTGGAVPSIANVVDSKEWRTVRQRCIFCSYHFSIDEY